MAIDLKQLINDNLGTNNQLHADYINPQLAKVLKTIGFDKSYTKAHGPYLYDKDGKEYLDFLSGYGVYAFGRNHPKIKQVLKDYIDLDEANLIQMEAPLMSGLLAKKLVSLMSDPELNTVFFTNSGTEANEAAIKYARAATGREKMIYMDHAFHGLSSGSLSMNGGSEFQKGFGPLLPAVKIPFNDLAALEKELKNKDIAAFFFEPIQGKGVYVPTDDFLPEAEKLCRKYGTLLVADEVQTGLGRTGKWLAHTHWNVKPDIITIAKALSGGMVPVGATICKRWIYDKVFSKMERCVVHSSTFGQNNLAMVCGLAALDIIEEEKLLENARAVGSYLLEKLQELAKESEWIKEVRGRGLMIGIEFGKPQSLKNKIAWNVVHSMDKGLFGELVVIPLLSKHNILTQVSGHHQDIVKLIPPLTITKEHADKFVKALKDVLSDCGKVAGPIWEMGKNLMSAKGAQPA